MLSQNIGLGLAQNCHKWVYTDKRIHFKIVISFELFKKHAIQFNFDLKKLFAIIGNETVLNFFNLIKITQCQLCKTKSWIKALNKIISDHTTEILCDL